ncbi:MAG: hypothetical protein JSR57_09385 [Verrucomicrobia bacterium]|nr:hypothetical protein [Verrucomicrobiota bacterium]
MALIISCVSLLIALASAYKSFFVPAPPVSQEEGQAFEKKLLTHVKACIEYNEELNNKEDILALINSIEENHFQVETGNDDLRLKYVSSQGCIEHVLACAQALGDLDQLIGIIHTPTVATPLCVRPEAVEGALDESIRFDLNKLLTVRSRAQIVREYLTKGGKLYVVYPQGGLEKRNAEQQQIYKEELERFAGRLVDWVLSSKEIDPDMIGATYLFRNQQRQVFAFSIKSRQAIDIQNQAEWGIWFGAIDDASISERVNTVIDYLVNNNGPDPRKEVI